MSYKQLLPGIRALIFDVDGVLTNGQVLVTTEGEMLRSMNIKDGYALKTAVDQGFHVCIISGGSNEGVRKRLEGLGVTNIHLGVKDKVALLKTMMQELQLHKQEVLYMGDDLPDFQVMQEVGLPCCPQDAAQEIKSLSLYVSHRNGGYGCARDVIEQTLKVQDKWPVGSGIDARYD